jgi:hypothetical protein
MDAQNNQNSPVTVSINAQNAIDKIASTDPVLAPMTLTTLSALANAIASGISVNGLV